MLIVRWILAGAAIAAVAYRPRSSACALAVACAATLDVALGAPTSALPGTVAPLICLLAAALALAGLAQRSGLTERVADVLLAAARRNTARLYWLVCATCALLTAAISLDGAIVLVVPLLESLHRRGRAPLGPLFVGAVAVCNAFSLAVPLGNPTNLVLIARLGLSPGAFAARMLVPAAGAALLCAGLVALAERRALRTACPSGGGDGANPSPSPPPPHRCTRS